MKKSTTTNTRLAALYIRVSTADQGERFSLPSQLKALREKAAREGFSVREDLIFVDKHTGKVASRPAFDRMNSLVKTGMISAVFAYSVDRFSRKTEDALRLVREYKKHGVRLDFCEVFFEDTPVGRFTFTQLCAFSELWGEKIIEDSKRGSRQKLEQGLLTHGKAPFGYRYIDKRQPNGSRFVIDDQRVQVVRDIYNWRRSGMPTYQIAKRLHELGVQSMGRTGRGGGIWTRQGILNLLGNPTYKGQHVRSGIVVPCPAIIDERLWAEVQRINKETRAKYTGRPPKARYLLRSLLYCGKCGWRCLGTSSKSRYYYRCGNLLRVPYIRNCDAPEVRADKIEHAAWSAIWRLLKDPALLLQLGRRYYEAMETPEGDSTADLEHEHERLAAKIKTTRRMVQDNLIDYQEGKADIRAAEERIRRIEQELAAAGRVVSLPPLQVAQAAVREICNDAEPQTYERRRSILEGILDLRLTYHNRDLSIEGKIPVPTPAAASGGQKKCNSGVFDVGYDLCG
jgi:site-specific DNA recombinase